jgi:Putative MetA-pathway of phenol degradation
MIKHAVVALTVVMASGAVAQTTSDPAPDKSGYTLFDPTPDDQLRGFCTDRPLKANSPCTIDAGHFQYESDIINWTHAETAGVTTNTYLITNPTLKLGLTNTVDVEVNIAPYEIVTTNAPSGRQSFGGIGDFYARLKANLVGPEGGDFQAAIIPYVKAPTAAHGIGNGAVEEGIIVPLSFALPRDFTLVFDPEIDILRNEADYGHHANFQMLANVSHALSETVTGYAEIWGQANDDPADPTKQASLDLSAAWLARPDLQLDAGINIGLTPSTPKAQPYIGISQRF